MIPPRTRARPRVVIVQGWIRQYRRAFYELLREGLAAEGVDLEVVHGEPRGVHGGRGDAITLPWATPIDQRELRLGPYQMDWQPCLDRVRGADLVIVEQASRRLLNYVLLAAQVAGGPRVAFWGHGRNFQATTRAQQAAEAVKRVVSRQAHWFFAYNELSADVLDAVGFPAERVTVVGNSIDTLALTEARRRVTGADRDQLRSALGIQGRHTAIYCGAMYPEKRIPFLLQAAGEVRSRVPDLELVCIGSGVDRHLVDDAAALHPWIHAVGPRFGEDLVRHFSLGDVLMLPGLVGLAVLDAFALQVPLVTTTDALHSPEISYLTDGVDGVIVQGDGAGGTYADAVSRVLLDEGWRSHLAEGCRAGAVRHSVESMAARFTDGVLSALAAPPRGLASVMSSHMSSHRTAGDAQFGHRHAQ